MKERRKRAARDPGAVERTALGRSGRGAKCPKCFVLLEPRVQRST
jgi:hypothetical protein